MDALDDAAAAALYRLLHARNEEIGLLYQGSSGIERTATQSSGGTRRSRGTFQIQPGSLRGVFHNHPARELARGARGGEDSEREQFSGDDILQARTLGVPSYIGIGDRVRRYDPRTGKTEDVLAEFPIDEWRAHIMRTVLGRDPSDPRGPYK